jgi:hypothetical protein
VKTAVAAALALVLAPGALALPLRLGFTPTDPLAPKQYYLAQDRAFDAFPGELPVLNTVKVAIIDSGIDGAHPEFKGRISVARSWVGGSALTDEEGHGTFVAGMIAATLNNNEGIAGMAFPAQLVIAKIARSDQTIDVRDEAEAIRWAADMGARVINLSIGGLRDPFNPRRDTFSRLEANAIEYAVRKGAVLVAAVGNSDEAPQTPWPYASYPAALPHVIGVSALTPTGNVPNFSDRAAAAALLFALKPTLQPDQVINIVERSATDVNASNGCKQCPLQRDTFSGWGRLDVAKAIAALDGVIPPPDRLEPNDDAGSSAVRLSARVTSVKATIDFWDDQIDVYRIYLRKGQRVRLTLVGPEGANSNLLLWRPGTKRVGDLHSQNRRAAQAIGPGASHKLGHRATVKGWYYVEAKLATRGFGPYELTIRR